MPPPPTPSSRRFIIKKVTRAPARRTPLAQSHTPGSSSQQFNTAPRFTIASTSRPTAFQTSSDHASGAGRFTTSASKPASSRDLIDDLSDVDVDVDDLHQSIESDIYEGRNAQQIYESENDGDNFDLEGEPTPKRARLTTTAVEPDSGQDTLRRNPTPKSELSELLSSSIPSLPSPKSRRPRSSHVNIGVNPHHKFLLSTPTPATIRPASTSPEQPFTKPPRFLPFEAPGEQSTSDPHPEQFSPHRRGQKYIAGGLAFEVRDWLANISSSIPPPYQRAERDPWLVEILISEVSGGAKAGMTLVRGHQVHVDDGRKVVDYLGELRVMLAGEGMRTGVQKTERVKAGAVVGVKNPVWEVVVEGLTWGVGVEWQIVDAEGGNNV